MKLTALQQQALELIEAGYVVWRSGEKFPQWIGGEYPFDARLPNGMDRDFGAQFLALIKIGVAAKQQSEFGTTHQIVIK